MQFCKSWKNTPAWGSIVSISNYLYPGFQFSRNIDMFASELKTVDFSMDTNTIIFWIAILMDLSRSII